MKLLQRAVLALVLACAPLAAAAQYDFLPYPVNTATATAATTTAATALVLPSPVGRRFQVRVVNVGATPVFINFGTAGVAATTASMPVAAGATNIFSVPEGTTHVGTIVGTGTAVIYFTAGEGL